MGAETATIADDRGAYELQPARRRERWLGALAVVALLVVAGAWLMYETRGTTLWFDEWQWALQYKENALHDILTPHNGHATLVPVTIYRLLFATVGIAHSAPYRAVGIAGHLLCVALLYRYAVRRVGVGIALLAAGSILFLGPGWQDILWPLQIAWLISLAGGLMALLALDRGDRRGEVVACAALVVAVFSSGPGVAIAAGIVVEVLLTRGWRSLWIVAVPLGLFALWWLGYQDAGDVRHELGPAPEFAADSAAAALSALAGLAGPLISDQSTALGWGRPLVVAAAALLVWRLWRMPRIPTRVLTLLAMLGAFWLLTAIERAGLGPAAASRYVYAAAVLVVALAVELLTGVTLSRRAWLVAACAAVVVLVANTASMRTGARFLRDQGLLTRIGLTTLDITRPVVAPDHPAAGLPGYPFVVVRAGQYFALARDLGTPAASVGELVRASEDIRRAADDELLRIHGVALQPGRPPAGAGAPPAVDGASGGTVVKHGGCVTFVPVPAGGAAPTLDLTIPADGLAVSARGGATVKVRRFADAFPAAPVGRVAPGGTGTLAIRRDLAANPWHARVQPEGRTTACSR